VRIETCGGGGYGPAWQRDPELVVRDVREGKVSPERARGVYGVAIDTNAWTVDTDATRRLRQAMGSSERDA
jgi:N-methylhydantoinase B